MDYKLLTTDVHLRKQRIILMTNSSRSACRKTGISILSVDFTGTFEILHQHEHKFFQLYESSEIQYRWKNSIPIVDIYKKNTTDEM